MGNSTILDVVLTEQWISEAFEDAGFDHIACRNDVSTEKQMNLYSLKWLEGFMNLFLLKTYENYKTHNLSNIYHLFLLKH